MKLHLGCGNKYLPGYTHIDIMEYDHIDFVASVDCLDMFEDQCVEEIYACHVLEHFSRHQNEPILKEWHRVLQDNGILRIAVPNFAAIAERYKKRGSLEELMGLLYGGQNYEYNYHCQVFDFSRLKECLCKVGFTAVSTYRQDDFLPEGFDDFSRAYLPHMDFENGDLMSLNVIARKMLALKSHV